MECLPLLKKCWEKPNAYAIYLTKILLKKSSLFWKITKSHLVRDHHMFSPTLNFLFVIVFSWRMVFCNQNCSVRKNCSSDREKTFEIRGWRPRICKIFEITRTIYSNSGRSGQFLLTKCFFNLFLEVSQVKKLEQL